VAVGDLFSTIAVTLVLCLPLALSLWALLDCARRPAWAWALAGRRQVVWMAVILLGFLSVVGGIVVSAVYLLRIRPQVGAAEEGRFPGHDRGRS
jgi:hypothetical protein